MILYAKFGKHQPLNRQSESFAREGIELGVSTLADWVGACTASLAPLNELIHRHVFRAERVHGDDTTVPVLAKGKTIIGRLWTYVRDDRPFAGPDPPAAASFYSRNRGGEHPSRHLAGYAGILQADAYAGFGDLYDGKRKLGPITEAARWSRGRRHFFELADLRKAPLAIAAVRRIDEIFAIERRINGLSVGARLAARQREAKRWSPSWNVRKPSLRVDVVELGRGDQGVHRRRALAAAIGRAKTAFRVASFSARRPPLPRPAPHGNSAQCALSGVVGTWPDGRPDPGPA